MFVFAKSYCNKIVHINGRGSFLHKSSVNNNKMTAEHAVARFIRAQNSDLEWRGW